MIDYRHPNRPAIVTGPREMFACRMGRVSAIHTVPLGGEFTLCGRPIGDMTTLPSDPWAAMGFRHASSGSCQRCAARAPKPVSLVKRSV